MSVEVAEELETTTEKCRHCKPGAETFSYLKRSYKFDVTLARELVLDGREPVEVDNESVRQSVEETRIYPEHLPHVDTQYPGIISHVWYPLDNGELVSGHLLIDGNHRAARCLQLGIPYFAYLLTEEESRQILLKTPEKKRNKKRS